MIDYMDFDCVPCDEKCEQVGMPGYNPLRARAECRAYLNQLRRMFGEPPDGCRLVIRSNPHDAGDYLTVAARYDSSDEWALKWALNVERRLPSRWDPEARRELGIPMFAENVLPPNLFEQAEDHDD